MVPPCLWNHSFFGSIYYCSEILEKFPLFNYSPKVLHLIFQPLTCLFPPVNFEKKLKISIEFYWGNAVMVTTFQDAFRKAICLINKPQKHSDMYQMKRAFFYFKKIRVSFHDSISAFSNLLSYFCNYQIVL